MSSSKWRGKAVGDAGAEALVVWALGEVQLLLYLCEDGQKRCAIMRYQAGALDMRIAAVGFERSIYERAFSKATRRHRTRRCVP